MRGGKVFKLALLAAIGAAVAAAIRSLRGEPAPVFSNHPTVTGGPPKVPAPVAPAPEAAEPVAAAPAPEPIAEPIAEVEAEAEAEVVPEPVVPTEGAAGTSPAWVLPVDDECPPGYPVKVKLRSGIFHAPGTATYDRTKPDRCYPDVASAEADGMPRSEALMPTFTAPLELNGKTATGIEVPPAVLEALGGGKRPKVKVTIGGFSFSTAVGVMGGRTLIPVSAERRAGAGVEAGQELEVTIELDASPTVIDVPDDLAAALDAAGVRAAFDALAPSHRKEHVRAIVDAKKPETRQRRIDACIAKLTA